MQVWTIEVADGPHWTAESWRRSYGERLVETAVTYGAREWAWLVRDWGTLVELVFTDDDAWQLFRHAPGVQSALEAAPDTEHGLWVYSGRGGSSAARVPRRPRPTRQSDSAPPPEPEPTAEYWQQPLGMRDGRFEQTSGSRRD